MIPNISSLSYDERLYKCGILYLEMRKLCSDLILVLWQVPCFCVLLIVKRCEIRTILLLKKKNALIFK